MHVELYVKNLQKKSDCVEHYLKLESMIEIKESTIDARMIDDDADFS